MGAEPRVFGIAGNAHCRHGLRQIAGVAFQALQGRQSFWRAHQFCSTRIGTVFALAAEPHHNNAGKEAEYNPARPC